MSNYVEAGYVESGYVQEAARPPSLPASGGAWGRSWGAAWGLAWGAIERAAQPTGQPAGGGSRRRQFDDASDLDLRRLVDEKWEALHHQAPAPAPVDARTRRPAQQPQEAQPGEPADRHQTPAITARLTPATDERGGQGVSASASAVPAPAQVDAAGLAQIIDDDEDALLLMLAELA